jgi:DNA-directed RNA polymerase subunit RPC12/RpoP
MVDIRPTTTEATVNETVKCADCGKDIEATEDCTYPGGRRVMMSVSVRIVPKGNPYGYTSDSSHYQSVDGLLCVACADKRRDDMFATAVKWEASR